MMPCQVRFLTAFTSMMLVVLLVMAFALHAVQISHAHVHTDASSAHTGVLAGLGEYAHHAEQKLLLFIVLIALGAGALAVIQPVLRVVTQLLWSKIPDEIIVVPTLTRFDMCIRRGLYSPKLH